MAKRHWLIVIGAAFVVSVALAVALLLRPPRLYRVIELPSIDGSSMCAMALNDQGQVVGFTESSAGTRLFLWDRERGIRDLGVTCNTNMLDINNRGQIVGTTRDPNGVEQAFLWDPNSGIHLLGTLGGIMSQARAVNNHGWVIGDYYRGDSDLHAFLWDRAHGMRDLASVEKGCLLAWTLNDANQALAFDNEGSLVIRMDEQGTVQTCDPVPIKTAMRMNASGRVAGVAMVTHRKTVLACWDPNAGLQTLSPDGFETSVSAINDAGQVLFSQVRHASLHLFGRILIRARHKSFLWDPRRGEIAMDRYVSLGKGEVLGLRDINNEGCVLGSVFSQETGRCRVVLLEPIPERWRE